MYSVAFTLLLYIHSFATATTANTTTTAADPPTDVSLNNWYSVPTGKTCEYMEAACTNKCASLGGSQFQCTSTSISLTEFQYSCQCSPFNGTYQDLGDGNVPGPSIPDDPSEIKTSYIVLLEDTVSPSSCKSLASYGCSLHFAIARYGSSLYVDPGNDLSGVACPTGSAVLDANVATGAFGEAVRTDFTIQPVQSSNRVEVTRYLVEGECSGEYLVAGEPLFDMPASGAALRRAGGAAVLLLIGAAMQLA